MSAAATNDKSGHPPNGSATDASEKQRRLEAWYAAALNYDQSWVVPTNDFHTWRKGKTRPSGEHQPRTSDGTIFDRLVKLGVLKKIEGPIPLRNEWEEKA